MWALHEKFPNITTCTALRLCSMNYSCNLNPSSSENIPNATINRREHFKTNCSYCVCVALERETLSSLILVGASPMSSPYCLSSSSRQHTDQADFESWLRCFQAEFLLHNFHLTHQLGRLCPRYESLLNPKPNAICWMTQLVGLHSAEKRGNFVSDFHHVYLSSNLL